MSKAKVLKMREKVNVMGFHQIPSWGEKPKHATHVVKSLQDHGQFSGQTGTYSIPVARFCLPCNA